MKHFTNAKIIQQWSKVPQSFAKSFGDEGDFARQYLLNPAIFSLLGDIRGKKVLDAGCGTGYLARMLNKQGAQVVGLEPATPLIQYAMGREQQEPLGIEYIQADLAIWDDASHYFDIVVANMVLMDIPDYEGALDTCFAHLRKGGQFIFSIAHPCFEGTDSEYHVNGYMAVREYFQEYCIEQRWGYRFHRPLSQYLNAVLHRGGVIQAVIEPQLDGKQIQVTKEMKRNLHVPGFIVFEVSKS